MAVAPGTRFGSYEVAALVGVGGMGEVYRARDQTLKRDVALKLLPEELTDASNLARLRREAEILASLNHANVAQIYGLESSGGRTALVMELIDGPTLAERIAQGPLQPNEALAIAVQLASALEAAHEQGIVHRDLKPANIKVKAGGTVKVIDFGIAKALGTATGTQGKTSTAMTEVGSVLGTAPYMSPEQARGNAVDKRADIWAFGCVLYEMLTGRPAFLGDDATSTLARVLERDPDMQRLPRELPAAVRRTLELCLQKDPAQRLRDIGDARLALEGKFAATDPPPQPVRRYTLPAAAVLLVGAVSAGIYVATLARPAASAPPALVTRFVITPSATAPLSNLGGFDFAISNDGRRLAYLGQNAEKNGVALYVREIDALEPMLLPGTEVLNPSPNVNPFFSPDGKSIGFAAPDGSVIRARVDGAPPQKVFQSELIFGAAWLTDEAAIVATGARLERIALDGAVEPLTSEVENQFVAAPSLLPDGKAVLFMSRDGLVPRVALLDLETREQKILIEGGQRPLYATSGHIVFARDATLMAAPFDATRRVVTGEPVTVLEGLRGETNASPDFALSANGTLAYVAAPSKERWRGPLVWVDRSGQVVARATAESLDEPEDPRLSPDGMRVVVTVGAVGEGRLWIHDLRGRPPIPLTERAPVGAAVWSPDGRELAFTDFNPTVWPIYTVSAGAGSLAQRLPSAAGVTQDWSTTGEVLFVAVRDIRGAPVAGGPARDVIATAANEFDAALAPNGRWLAYVSDRTGQAEVWVQSYPDAVTAPVRVSASGGYEPRWSADGRELFFRQGDSMYAAAVADEQDLVFEVPQLLFSGRFFDAPSPESSSYDVAPDGRFLMIQIEETSDANDEPASIVVVQNWLEELKQRVPTK
jgi:Tol biopolymer transport system component